METIQGTRLLKKFSAKFLVFWQRVGGRDILDTWVDVAEFPQYEVSDQGEIRNNGRDSMYVTLSDNGGQYTRSVRRLVAIAYLGDPMNDDVAIPIDGDHYNNRADNLVWKPMWFAVKMKRQQRRTRPVYDFRIRELETGRIFENSRHASQELDILEDDVVLRVDAGYKLQPVW
jgi:hypothetical protein